MSSTESLFPEINRLNKQKTETLSERSSRNQQEQSLSEVKARRNSRSTISSENGKPRPKSEPCTLRPNRTPVTDFKPMIKNGELWMGARPLDNDGNPKTILTVLLELDAEDALIEKYVHPIGTPVSWEKWLRVKRVRQIRRKRNGL